MVVRKRHIEKMVPTYEHCVKDRTNLKQPLIVSEYPWPRVGTDIFILDGTTYMYLIASDYHCHYPEVIKLTSTTSLSVISALKSRYGIA